MSKHTNGSQVVTEARAAELARFACDNLAHGNDSPLVAVVKHMFLGAWEALRVTMPQTDRRKLLSELLRREDPMFGEINIESGATIPERERTPEPKRRGRAKQSA